MAYLEFFNGTQWISVNRVIGTGTVTSVGITGSPGLTVTGSPITRSGSIGLDLDISLQSIANSAANWGTSLGIITKKAKAGTGNAVTGFDLYSPISIEGTADQINVINGDGVSGNPTISLTDTLSITIPTEFSCPTLTVNKQGRITDISSNPFITSINSGTGVSVNTTNSASTISLSTQLQNLHSLSTNGIMVRTGANTFATRSLAVGTGLSVANPDGVLGNPNISLSTQLQNLHNLNSVGFVSLSSATSGASTFVNRTLTAGNGISIANGSGASANPTISVSGPLYNSASNGTFSLLSNTNIVMSLCVDTATNIWNSWTKVGLQGVQGTKKNFFVPSGDRFAFIYQDTASTNTQLLEVYIANTSKAYVDSTTGNWTVGSDENLKWSFRKKEANQKYIDRILSLPIYSYCWEYSDKHMKHKVSIGTTHQDVYRVFEGACTNKVKWHDEFECKIQDCEKCNESENITPSIDNTQIAYYHLLAFQSYVKQTEERLKKLEQYLNNKEKLVNG